MALVWDPAAVLNVASGLSMGVLGAALLLADPDRDWNRLFGLLAVLWGVQIVSANTIRLAATRETALLAGQISLAFLIPLYFFFVSFASIFPRPRPPFGTSAPAVLLLALPAVAALGVLFFDATLLLQGVTSTTASSFTVNWGPLLPYLVTAPFFGALSYTLYVMMERLDETTSPRESRQVGAVLGALGLYAGYQAPRQLAAFGGEALGLGTAEEAAGTEVQLIALVLAVTVAILALIVVRLAGRLRRQAGEARRSPAATALVLVSAGLVGALAVETVAGLGGPELDLLGLFRFGTVAIIVYAIARYQLFDLDLRAKRWSALAAAGLAVSAIAGAAYIGLRALAVDTSTQLVTTGVVGLVAVVPMLRASFHLANRIAPDVSEEGDHLYLRKLEVYRAAVEQRLSWGEDVSPGDPELAELRGRLGLGEGDHGVVVTLARSKGDKASAEESLAPGDEAFGKYELEEVIAEGGFGRILRARDAMLGRPVVIKELRSKWRDDEAIADRLLREARIAGQISHPNIVSVYGIEEHGGDHYIVMEHVPGGSLEERLASGPLPAEEAVRVTREVLSALDAAHGNDIVHRDVKPANVLFDDQDRVKLTDFGIAHLTRQDPEETISGLQSPEGQPGTLSYMSPEQARGDPVDARSDLYSAGALLYRCLTGDPPTDVEGLGELAAREAIAQADPPETDELPEGLAEVVERALARDPEERFPSAQAFLDALDEIEDDLRSA